MLKNCGRVLGFLVASTLSLTACGEDDATPAATVTKTVAVTPSPTETPMDGDVNPVEIDSDAVPEPGAQDYRATAIYTLQTETQAFADYSDEALTELLETACGLYVMTDGETVRESDFTYVDSLLMASDPTPAEAATFMRASVAFCPEHMDAIMKHLEK